ncbi:RHS repeat domain-containing protein [Pseudomonas japonica]|uniref:RHS repeat domain-containing protein n=1 Tax=Pseudomonas japonica TaxID=256466 RepID=UPI0038170A5E
MTAPASPHTATPTLAAVDPRGLALRTVGYCRAHSDQAPAARIERCAHNAAGQRQASWDPRLWAQGSVANLRQVYGLSGRLLLNDSVDAGWSLQLLAESALPVLVWDARGTRRRLAYDERLRPVEIAETPAQGSEKVSERYEYAGADSGFTVHNQCGRLLRHDDPGGTLHLRGYALSAALCRQTRHFLQSLDAVDWPSAAAERDALLEPGAGFSSHEVHDAAGQLISRTDARGNQTLFRHTLDARPGPIALRLAGAGSATALLTRVTYDAWGQVEQQTAGNGVLSHYTRDPASGRLLRLQHGVPGLPALQDLHYRHDPRGNLVEIVDAAMPVRHFANQRIEPRCTYRYDSLYQLVEASGHEFADAVPGPGLPPLQGLPADPARQCNYRQHYHYDAAGNLRCLRHVGGHGYTRQMQVASDSNRALPVALARADFDSAFDAAGNLLRLLPGQDLSWNPRNQLERIRPVAREQAADDEECYRYDSAGQRLRKITRRQASGRSLLAEVRYLPGLELRSDDASGERLQVIRCGVAEVLHWEQGRPSRLANDQQRYPLRDHLGSHNLELDEQATLLTHEIHYPFGGTAWWAASSSSQARCKWRRHAAREMDASGLYYYGQRYYAPWLQRWISADPAGPVDGLNLYRMVGNDPLNFGDHQGTVKIPVDILLVDVLDPISESIGTGWYEELRWDAGSHGFMPSRTVYSRGMAPLSSAEAQWSLSEEGSAVALFRDRHGSLRLFANTFHQHMGIQPDMGLPLFAGLLQRGSDGQAVFSNHSGHYKPPAAVTEVAALLEELAPAASLRYAPIAESAGFETRPRLDQVTGPEAYADLVKGFRADKSRLIDYLKSNDLWDAARAEHQDNEVLNVLFEMADHGLSADQVHQQRRARAQTAVMPSRPQRQRPSNPPPPSRQSAVVPRRPGGLFAVLRKCVGR